MPRNSSRNASGDSDGQIHRSNSISGSPASSFSHVYPIRSLLSGIQPAEPVSPQHSDDAGISVSRKSSVASSASRRSSLGGDQALLAQVASDMVASPSRLPSSLPVQDVHSRPPANLPTMDRVAVSTQPSIAEEDSTPTEVTAPGAASQGKEPSASLLLSSSQSPAGSPISLTRADLDAPAASGAEAGDPPDSSGDMEEHLLFKPSAWNIVHLPPVSDGSSGSTRRSASSRQSNWHSSNTSSNQAAGSYSQPRITAPGSLASGARRGVEGGEASTGGGSREENEAMDREERETGSSAPSPASMSDLSESGVLRTSRFEHVEDEHGHHILTGREGKLMRCEDEPIRTPGAVQGFGVLIAVEELEDTMLVRQVSENSTEILGLSPNYLFGLECFTDTLPEAQASLLWDAIQFLSEPETNQADSEDDSPHVFLISGYTAPNFAAEDDGDADKQGRKTWTCWCAVHRPPPVSTEGHEASPMNMIILEFELEKDTLHPLYPSVSDYASNSPLSSGSTAAEDSLGGSAGNSTDGSERTLVQGQTVRQPLGSITEDGSPASTPPAGNAPASDLTPGAQTSTAAATDDAATLLQRPASVAASAGDVQCWPADQTVPHRGLVGEDSWIPSAEDILESTTSISRPLLALDRLRRMTMRSGTPAAESGGSARARRRRGQDKAQPGSVGMMDIFAVMSQINGQLGAATDLETFLKLVAGVIKDLTQFHRVLVYQFDEVWNGQVVAELVDWSQTHDLYRGLHFPASDIPAQARELYAINKVRILYDREQSTARIVVRSKEDLNVPLNMTHSYLRAMSPIHLKYLGNMGVRASMSVSIMAFGVLWGLVACHSYGTHGMRVSFPVRQMLRLLSQSISKNIERLSYASRLHTRKLINTISSTNHPTGYIISNADDLLGLFDADYGILVIGEGAKILGPNLHGQEILIVAEYLRIKQFNSIQVSQAVTVDFPDLQISTGLEIVAGLLYVPLSTGGQDFMAFLRRGQPRDVHWAGKPYKEGASADARLEPRKSFKSWSERVAGRCRAWTDEQLETAGVMALVYGKFIEVWRQKETALQTTKLTNILLSNASHEVRTPLNHIINYLELALNGSLDGETRDNLSRSHAASKSLLFTINDLLDLTRLEIGGETAFNEPFDLQTEIIDATRTYKNEAERRKLHFTLDVANGPSIVIGDAKKIRTVVQNLTANALKYTDSGGITIRSVTFSEPEGLRDKQQTAVEIVVEDTGCGIAPAKLESIFREFEQVESAEPKTSTEPGVGLGLAVVARIVEQLGGQLRVDSQVNGGSRFSFLIPLGLQGNGPSSSQGGATPSSAGSSQASAASSFGQISKPRSRTLSHNSASSKIDSLVEALSTSHMQPRAAAADVHKESQPGTVDIQGSSRPLRPVRIDGFDLDKPSSPPSAQRPTEIRLPKPASREALCATDPSAKQTLRILIVEDNELNSNMLAKRLTKDGHEIVQTLNGQEGLDKIIEDREFDAILMDIQMPILNGFEATERIREVEKGNASQSQPASDRLNSFRLNGRIPIFAVSASLQEQQYEELKNYGLDGWILKPINFKRLSTILHGIVDIHQRQADLYAPGHVWEEGGWLVPSPYLSSDPNALPP